MDKTPSQSISRAAVPASPKAVRASRYRGLPAGCGQTCPSRRAGSRKTQSQPANTQNKSCRGEGLPAAPVNPQTVRRNRVWRLQRALPPPQERKGRDTCWRSAGLAGRKRKDRAEALSCRRMLLGGKEPPAGKPCEGNLERGGSRSASQRRGRVKGN